MKDGYMCLSVLGRVATVPINCCQNCEACTPLWPCDFIGIFDCFNSLRKQVAKDKLLGQPQMCPTEPSTVPEGKKYDSGKPHWDLLPLSAVEPMVQVLTFGATKYDANNWQSLPDYENRYFAACMRHLRAYQSGELVDGESGLSHLAHAMTNIMFLIHKQQKDEKENVSKG